MFQKGTSSKKNCFNFKKKEGLEITLGPFHKPLIHPNGLMYDHSGVCHVCKQVGLALNQRGVHPQLN